jgi:hypothetical protein
VEEGAQYFPPADLVANGILEVIHDSVCAEGYGFGEETIVICGDEVDRSSWASSLAHSVRVFVVVVVVDAAAGIGGGVCARRRQGTTEEVVANGE